METQSQREVIPEFTIGEFVCFTRDAVARMEAKSRYSGVASDKFLVVDVPFFVPMFDENGLWVCDDPGWRVLAIKVYPDAYFQEGMDMRNDVDRISDFRSRESVAPRAIYLRCDDIMKGYPSDRDALPRAAVWRAECGNCASVLEHPTASETNPYPNGLFCPECRKRGHGPCLGVLNFKPLLEPAAAV